MTAGAAEALVLAAAPGLVPVLLQDVPPVCWGAAITLLTGPRDCVVLLLALLLLMMDFLW